MKICPCCVIAFLLCLNIFVNGKSSPMRLVCLFPADSIKYSVDYLDPYLLCSHILFDSSYLYPTTNTDCKLRFSTEKRNNSDLTQNNEYQEFMKLDKKNPQLKVMLSIGTHKLKDLLTEIVACRNRIRNELQLTADDAIFELIQHYKFSGLDIYYLSMIDEYTSDVLVLTQQALKRIGVLLSFTISDNRFIDEVSIKFNHIADFINFESFNMDIDGKISHHAPLYENFPNNPSPRRQNMNETVNLIKSHFPLNKINWGMFFGSSGCKIPPNLNDTRPPVTILNGWYYMSYPEICYKHRRGGWQVFYEDVFRNISPYAVAPMNIPERKWISFEDLHTVIVKSNYIIDNGLGGVFLRSIGSDDFDNNCGEGPYPLITAVSRTLKISFPSLIRDENVALRCNIAFTLGLLIVFCYVVTLIYVFVKLYLITRRSRYTDLPTTNDEYAEMEVIYDTID